MQLKLAQLVDISIWTSFILRVILAFRRVDEETSSSYWKVHEKSNMDAS